MVMYSQKSSGVDHAATKTLWRRSYSYENAIGVDHAATKIHSIGSYTNRYPAEWIRNHKITTDWIIYEVAKTDENDFVVKEIQRNGSFGDKNIWVCGLKIKYKGLDHVATKRPK
jgi:hypothetical protein